MTITSTASEISYAGDGTSTEFAIPFVFDTSADLKVIQTDDDGNPVVLSSGFSVAGGGGSTGTLTLTTALPVDETLTILDDPERKQTIDYINNDSFPAESAEGGFDKVTRMVKRMYQMIQKSARVSDGDPAAGSGMLIGSVDARKGKYLFFNAVSGAIEYAASLTQTTLSQSVIGDLLFPQSADEATNGVTPLNKWHTSNEYGFQNILRHGDNDTPGTTDMAAACQKAVNALSATEGGIVMIPAGRYSFNSANVQVDGSTFVNGGVFFYLHPRAVIEVEGDCTIGFDFVGASSASPMTRCGIIGGRIVGSEDGALYGVRAKDVTNFVSRDTSCVQFKSTGRGDFEGTHDGSGNAAILSDSTASWTADALIGLTIFNITDGSYGTITDNDTTTVTATLAGGTDNDWDASDVYVIRGRCGMLLEYAIWSMIDHPQIDNCDNGLNIDGSLDDAFRGTTCFVNGGSIRTSHRGVRVVDGFGHQLSGCAIENNSIGVDFDWRRQTGINSAGCEVRAYMERNGRHVRVRSHGTARSSSLTFKGLPFENVNTTYVGGVTNFEDANSGDYKLDIDGDDIIIDSSLWSTAPNTADILIDSDCERTFIRKQGEQASGFSVSDASSSTLYEEGAYEEYQSITDADATPSVKGGKTFVTGNTGSTTITDLDDGYIGQEVVVRIGDANTTVDFTGTNLRGNAGVDWTPTTNDFMVCRKVTSSIWLCEVHDTTA